MIYGSNCDFGKYTRMEKSQSMVTDEVKGQQGITSEYTAGE